MSKQSLDIDNESKCYLDEKELFILFTLLKNKRISTLWSNVFIPNDCRQINIPDDVEDKVKAYEELATRLHESMRSKEQSPLVLSYLLELGKEVDGKGFSIFCNADYSLVEGGFMSEYVGDIMYKYLEDTAENREKSEKYKIFSNKQIDFLSVTIEKNDFDSREFSIEFSKLANPPIKEYQEAILKKDADKDFIALVNKLITEYDGGRWDKSDATQFLEIYYRHNKEEFSKNVSTRRTFLYKDAQTKLAKIIFGNIDIHLGIKNTKKLERCLSQYITLFIDDKLSGQGKYGLTKSFFSEGMSIPLYTKFFGFKKQREILVKHIEAKYNEYQRNDLEIGHPYIEPEYIGGDKKDSVKITVLEKNKERDLFLFVHTMLALEHEKYLEIEDFSYGTTGIFDLYDRGFLFKIKLKNSKEDTHGQKLFEGYDKKYHLLKVAGKEIELAKKGRETDSVLLLETLLKAKNAEWKHNDEILADWGNNYEDTVRLPKNKIYFAGKKINNAVALKTQIEDFIECNTSKARINPKYRKVDE